MIEKSVECDAGAVLTHPGEFANGVVAGDGYRRKSGDEEQDQNQFPPLPPMTRQPSK
jgi:hypothetical protein